MVVDRYLHTATLLPDGKVLVAGGRDSNDQTLASAELYDPSTGTWTTTASMTEARGGHIATLLLNGRVLVVGGGVGPSTELYDPGTGTWSATGSTMEGRKYQSATLLPDGKVLVAGGHGGGSDTAPIPASAALYDPLTGLWTATGTMLAIRDSHTATTLPDGAVLLASVSGDPLDSAELYDPTSGTWAVTGIMIEARYIHTATRLPDGKVLVAGGVNGVSGRSTASAELYNPSSGTWLAAGTMGGVRHYHTATLLPDGRVLVAGGDGRYEGADDPLASAELYDPSSETWTAASSMLEAHWGHTATALRDGTVLVVGGSTNRIGTDVIRLASAELYNPAPPP